MITIKKILLAGFLILGLIWGVIFYLTFTDSSYTLFVPQLPAFFLSASRPESSIELPENGPWKQDLFMAMGGSTTSFDGKAFIAHSTATPSAVLRNSELLVYFNFFPQNTRRGFGTIHLVKSLTNGKQWTSPLQVVINHAPAFDTVPFSPKVIVTANNKVKLFFLAKKHGENQTKMFSAVSDDGQQFTFDPKTEFSIENESLTSIAITIVEDRMHLIAYTNKGEFISTAYHAISYDSTVFTRLADITIKDSIYGQNSLISEGKNLILYGNSTKGLWMSNSGNGNSWSNPRYLNVNVKDPSVVKSGDTFFLFYTDSTAP